MKTSILSILIMSAHSCVIRSPDKLCKNCKYFIPYKNECRLFGKTDYISANHLYDNAEKIRNSDDKCGYVGKMYEENNFKLITYPYYFIKNYWYFSPLAILCSTYIYTIISH